MCSAVCKYFWVIGVIDTVSVNRPGSVTPQNSWQDSTVAKLLSFC